jgi:hypothetical protein
MNRLVKTGGRKLAATGRRYGKRWYDNGAVLWALGALAVTGIGLLTFMALTFLSQ